uniref:Uncharacterized protein n=1 Tax=Quercus lobata TaxID=97700 RepID=A0A7N2N525_QUELO
MSCDKASTPSTAPRWKGAKCTTEHPMHVLRANHMSLASLRPNQFGMKQGIPVDVDTSTELHKITLQGKLDRKWVEVHATHILSWDAHAATADVPPFHKEMSYNDEYMVWFHPRTLRHITKEISYCDTLIYTDCINALKAVEEIGQLTLDDARVVSNTSEPIVGRDQQASGRQGHEGRQSSQRHTSNRRPTSSQRHTSGRRHTLVHDHTMEEANQTADEMCLDTRYDLGCHATSPLPSIAHDDAGPSHTFAHRDTSWSPSMTCDDTCPPISSTTSPLPTIRTSPPSITGIAPPDVRDRDEMKFMPTPGQPTPCAVPPE